MSPDEVFDLMDEDQDGRATCYDGRKYANVYTREHERDVGGENTDGVDVLLLAPAAPPPVVTAGCEMKQSNIRSTKLPRIKRSIMLS